MHWKSNRLWYVLRLLSFGYTYVDWDARIGGEEDLHTLCDKNVCAGALYGVKTLGVECGEQCKMAVLEATWRNVAG